LTEDKKSVASNPSTAVNEPAKKSEKAMVKNEKAGEKAAKANEVAVPTPAVAEQYPNQRDLPAVPNTSETAPDMSRLNRRELRRMGVPTTRNFPDGTQVTTLPDGTRVVTLPNGTKRVFLPGQKLPRRRLVP